jgi:type IV pilus assembly protein PilY1
VKRSITLLLAIIVAPLFMGTNQVCAVEPVMADYTHYPVFQINTVAPNILIILDNSSSMNLQAYIGEYNPGTIYYGYFEPSASYTYGSNVFVRDDNNGEWDGNFLNWLCMRRIDVTRKVLMGGLATARTGGGNQTNIGEASPAGYAFTKAYKDTGQVTGLLPDVDYTYVVDGGYFYVDGGTYTIRVQKDSTYSDEASNFVDGNIAGVLQKVGDKARWGLEFFNYGTGNNGSGGSIIRTIGSNMTDLITSIQNRACDTYTPLAEAYYVAMQYLKQEDVQSGLDYPNGCVPCSNIGDDPYWNDQWVYCADSYVILLTDGASTYDMRIPDFLTDVDGDGNDPGSYAESGSNYLDDVALYARTTNLRPDLDGDQNLILYTIYAFGSDPNAKTLLKDAARNGGFIDRDGDKRPNLSAEWDAESDGNPDTYYEADTGYLLEAQLMQAINDILARASSGTAVSILATSEEGEGNMVQAYFQPVVHRADLIDVNWVGFLQSLWVDSRGYLREDTNQNYGLDIGSDKVITYYLDSATGETRLKRYSVSESDPYPDLDLDTPELVQFYEISPVWEAGSRLAQRAAGDRTIFTYLDKDKDGVVDPYEVVSFDTNSAAQIRPYLGIEDDATWSYLGDNTPDERATNLIQYIRGVDKDSMGLRTRTIDGLVWKLGDIANSTPVSLSKPPDNYHVIYSDVSYDYYWQAQQNRETVVYVGANDGMLHAFTSWIYNSSSKQYQQPASTTEQIGDELWAYIPQSLLPHLKWLPSRDYTHVDYVDLKPKIFDAKIDLDNDLTPEWHTILLAGLNMGGKYIWAEGDYDNGSGTLLSETRDFYPSYVCMDVTDPRNPTLLWERSYTDLEMTASFPAVVKVKDKWFAVFGSGPTDYDGTSTKDGHIFVVDLKTGEPYRNSTYDKDWLFKTGEASAFMNGPVSLDKNLDFNCNALYFGETYLSGSWKGKVYKVSVPSVDGTGAYDDTDINNYVDNPLDAAYPWSLSCLFDATKPITAPVSLSMDAYDNAWVYVGTGRYLGTDDKLNTDPQYLFGLKDPFFNTAHTADGYYHNYSSSLELGLSDLLDADRYLVAEGGNAVYDSDSGANIGTFDYLLSLARQEDGWMRSLTTSGERVLTKSTVIGGLVLTPSFTPNDDVCSFGGDSTLYGFYYETGTAYYNPVFNGGTTTETIGEQSVTVISDKITLGEGKASAVGIHVGTAGVRSVVQQSTGMVLIEKVAPPLKVKSGLKSWHER